MALAGVCPVPWGLSCPLRSVLHAGNPLAPCPGHLVRLEPQHCLATCGLEAQGQPEQQICKNDVSLCHISPLRALGPAGRWGQALTLQGRCALPLHLPLWEAEPAVGDLASLSLHPPCPLTHPCPCSPPRPGPTPRGAAGAAAVLQAAREQASRPHVN